MPSFPFGSCREVAPQCFSLNQLIGRARLAMTRVATCIAKGWSSVERLCEAVDGYGLDHGCMHVEVIERVYTRDSASIAPVLAETRSHGFKVEIDDFGAGESSLGMLADIQADILKLDRSFLQSGLLDTRHIEVIKAVVQLARALKMGVIAEGVETEQQRDALVELGCFEAQGFLFHRPAPWQDFVGLG